MKVKQGLYSTPETEQINIDLIEAHLKSDIELDTSIDVTNYFINISVRCIDTNELINRSINLEELESTQLQRTKYIIDEIETMKDQVRGIY